MFTLRKGFVNLTLKATVVVTTLVVGVYAYTSSGGAEQTLHAAPHGGGGEITTKENNTVTESVTKSDEDREAIQKAENLIAEANNIKVLEDALNADRKPEASQYNIEWIVPNEKTVQLSINFRAVERIDGIKPILHKEYAAAVAKDVSYVLDEMNDRFYGGKAKTHEITLQILNETGTVMYEMGNGVK